MKHHIKKLYSFLKKKGLLREAEVEYVGAPIVAKFGASNSIKMLTKKNLEEMSNIQLGINKYLKSTKNDIITLCLLPKKPRLKSNQRNAKTPNQNAKDL